MQATDVIIIGAGQAGLATSQRLSQRGIDHVLLERGRVAERWRSERWDSLKLLTPNWQTRLPDYAYDGPEPDGFMAMPEIAERLEGYARRIAAPIHRHTHVSRVWSHGLGYRVRSDRGDFEAPNVVIASGFCDVPARPRAARSLSARVHQLAPGQYRNPASLPAGGVLVVGASASGVQIADELARSGREVTLAVGRHTRLPRRYRGADIMVWLDRLGVLDETLADQRNPAASIAQPSLQLTGSEAPRDLDLATLLELGVRIAGRLTVVSAERVHFETNLAEVTDRAEKKLARLLDRIDRFVAEQGPLAAADRPVPIDASSIPVIDRLDLAAERISSVIWATGFRRDYRWLHVPVLGVDGEIVHTRGITPAPGLYAMGLRFQHTRKSSFIDGVALDAEYVARDIAARLGVRESFAA